jgi:hypothetical protein
MMRRKILAFTASALALAALGCAPRVKNVTNLPAGVTQTQVQAWDSAVADLHKVAATTSTLRQSVIAIHAQGLFPDAKYAETLRAIVNVEVLEINAANFLQKTPNTFGETQKQFVTAQMNAILQELRQAIPEGLLAVKNANSQKQLNTLLAEVQAAVNLVLAL